MTARLKGATGILVTLLVAVFFTDLLRNLPQPVLAAIILVAVTGLVQIDTLRHIWRFSRTEFAVSMAALLGVLGSGLLNGVLLGVVISLILLLGRASRPPSGGRSSGAIRCRSTGGSTSAPAPRPRSSARSPRTS